MIYFTSDLHLGHDKDFLYAPRGFNSIEEHDLAIIQNWNNLITYEDDVYILGDLMLGDNDTGFHKLQQLNGKLHILYGNHDTDSRIELYNKLYSAVEILGYSNILKYGKYHFYLSHYPTLTSNYDEDKPLNRKTINICGHCHSKDKFKDMDKGLIYHVELDAHDNKPVSIETILEDIRRYTNGNSR